jgi:antitoxin HicB
MKKDCAHERRIMKNLSKYPFELRPLTDEEGGGYLISYLDFNECIADGETIEEAIIAGREALISVIETLESKGLPVPTPGSYGAYSGKFVQRIPKSLHARLQARARQEAVSINTLATTYIAEGLTRHAA